MEPKRLAPNNSWTEDATLKVEKSDRILPRWGNVKLACKILDGCDREIIYELIEIGAIQAFKRRPHRPNSHWRVDLLSVWNHKQKQFE